MTQQNMDELNAAIKASSDSFKIKLPMTERHFKIKGDKIVKEETGKYIYNCGIAGIFMKDFIK